MKDNYQASVQPPQIASGWAFNQEVASLITEWGESTVYMSSVSAIRDHPAYAQLRSLGFAAIPAILRAYHRSSAPVDLLLQDIVKTTPVPQSDWGNAERARLAWIAWGTKHELDAKRRVLSQLPAIRPTTAQLAT